VRVARSHVGRMRRILRRADLLATYRSTLFFTYGSTRSASIR